MPLINAIAPFPLIEFQLRSTDCNDVFSASARP